MSLFYPSFKSFLLALNLEWKMYFKWENTLLLILYIHAQIFIHEGDMLCIVFQRFTNYLLEIGLQIFDIFAHNSFKDRSTLIWVELFFLCQTEMSLFWFTLLSNDKDGELFDFFELGDAHFFTQLHYHIFSDLCEAIKITR